ncbi:MAG: bifunctional phosphopantothenoylcysteine decarboxylase/phosphopantothenate--cysteine ligase CoaBC [Oscillospiraceae bacterium]|nr:bifunctional phosphopantothenoylcysteine decarboxylase/phosphopantothenate--cysteine ligase CoaBC [Oscillospiraceae bacterium]
MKGKNVVIGITGGIAAYKTPNLVSMLVKSGYNVDVIMTENAGKFITPNTFEALTGRRCITDTFDRSHSFEIEHISLAEKADCFMIAPCTANVIGKIACGIADDMLTTTIMACKCKKIIVPAMNTNMYENPIVQENMDKLVRYGYEIVEADDGRLACGAVGKGKMPSPENLFEYIEKECRYEKDMKGLRVLVTAGATQEQIDPVRYITNHSTGKMGYAVAYDAMLRGAEVTLVSGKTNLQKPPFVKTVDVLSADDMFLAVKDNFDNTDIVVKSAAVADFTPVLTAKEKIKKSDNGISEIKLKRTEDIIGYLGEHKRKGQFICGFSMETENMLENSRKKLTKKNMDMIVANNLKTQGAGFGTDTNVVTIITEDEEKSLPIMSKKEVAHCILSEVLEKYKG